MAGAGQPYEVLNLAAAQAALAVFARDIGYPEGRAWFSLPGVVRFVTGEAFTARLETEQAETSIGEHATDVAERALLLRKLRAGGDFRLFVPEFLRHSGPDFAHIADWIRVLPEASPRMVGKLPRVTVPAAALLADRWSAATARKVAMAPGMGSIAEALDPGTGRVWVELLDAGALCAEAGMMAHCVHSYSERLALGTRLFSLRDWRGAALVTAEFRPGGQPKPGGKPVIGQIRGYRNAVPGRAVRADIAALLAHLGAGEDRRGEAASAGLHRGADGVWRCIDEVFEQVSFAGMRCLGMGMVLYLVSPLAADAMIASCVGENGWWRRPGGGYGPLRLGACGDRAFGIADQRAVARFVTEAGPNTGPAAHKLFPFLRSQDAAWLPWADTCGTRDVDGIECLVDPCGSIHLPRAADRAQILLNITKEKDGARDCLLAAPESERVWAAGDVRRIARVMTALGVSKLHRIDGGLRKAGLDMRPDFSWARLQDHTVEHPAAMADLTGRPAVWQVAPWVAYLQMGGRTLLSLQRDADGHATDLIGMGDRSNFEEAASLLNSLQIRPAANWSAGRFCPVRWHRLARDLSVAIFHLGGRWHVLTSADDFCDLLAGVTGGARPTDPVHIAAACSLLPPAGHSARSDGLLARYLAAWAKQEDRTVLLDAGSSRGATTHGLDHLPMRPGPADRLLDAGRLLGLMRPAESADVTRAAVAYILGAVGRRGRLKDLFTLPVGTVRDLLALFWSRMPQRVLDRAVPWCLDIGSIMVPADVRSGASADRVDTALLDLHDAMPPGSRARRAVARAADSSLWSLHSRGGHLPPKTPGEAEAWVRCIGAARDCYWPREGVEALRRMIRARALESADGWDAVEAHLDAAEAALPPPWRATGRSGDAAAA